MAHELTTSYLRDSIALFRHYKKLGEGAIAQCPDEALFVTLDHESNSIAIIVKHVAGNMRAGPIFSAPTGKSRIATATVNLKTLQRRALNSSPCGTPDGRFFSILSKACAIQT
jgi:hypothetical protein